MGVICGTPKNKNTTITTQDKDKEKEKPEIKTEEIKDSKELIKHSTKDDLEKLKTDQTTKEKSLLKSPEKLMVAIDTNVIISKGELNPRDLYIRKKILGQGTYGTVYLVKHLKLSRYYAMKVIRKTSNTKEEEEDIKNEVNILKKLDHPNIVKITDFYSLKSEYNIVTEYCQNGELFDEIKSEAPFNENVAGFYMYQILSAVLYCHNLNIIHRDLKPENILISKKVKSGMHNIKIIDFGTAKVFKNSENEHSVIGSAYYIAPEVLSKNYSLKCDLWSCGVIMYILLTGRPPFNGSNKSEIMKKILIGVYDKEKYPWGILSDDAKDLIKGLLQLNPNMRYDAKAALQHPWFDTNKVKSSKFCYNIKTKSLNKLLENLCNYKADNILRCAVIAYLVHNNTQLNQAHEAIKLFNRIDKNGDGRITREELFDGLQQFLKKSNTENLREKVDCIFNNIDLDHNNYIEYEEFVRAAIDKEYFLNEQFLKFAFDYFDRDHNGDITFDEIKNLFYKNDTNKNSYKAHEQLQKSFKEIDLNGDGKLSFDEFVLMMKNIINDDK